MATARAPSVSGLQADLDIGLSHGGIFINIDDGDLGAPGFACLCGMSHYVDLGMDGIRPPDNHEIRLRHLARVRAGQPAGAGNNACELRHGANGVDLPGIFLRMTQPVNAVTHDQSHCTGIVVRPNGLGTIFGLAGEQLFGNFIQGVIPGNWPKVSGIFVSHALQWRAQPVGMVQPFRVAGHLGTDDPRRISMVGGSTNSANPIVAENFNFEGAGTRAIMGAGALAYGRLQICLGHDGTKTIGSEARRPVPSTPARRYRGHAIVP